MPAAWAGALLAVVAATQVGQAQAARATATIHAHERGDGVVRYSLPLTIDGAVVEALLDTGSVGLRVLSGMEPNGGRAAETTYDYAGGITLRGPQVVADVSIGGTQARIRLQSVARVSCQGLRPRCSASGRSPDPFAFASDGLPGEGFRAVLGLGMAGKLQDNPLRALGVRRWIVRLPPPDRPGESGLLILDPSAAETADFVMVPLLGRLSWRADGAHDAIDGCLRGAGGAPKVCGAALLDTGAAGITLFNAGGPPQDWPRELVLSVGADAQGLETPAAVGPPGSQSGIVMARDDRAPHPLLLLDASAFAAFDLLYDPDKRAIGLRRRPAGG